jgi:hypothetical protein
MMRRRIVSVVFLLALALSTSAFAGLLVVPLPDGAKLELAVPASWKAAHETAGPAVTVKLSPSDKGDFAVLLTVLQVQPGSPASTPEGVREATIQSGNQQLPTAVQKTLELTEIKGPQAIGYLYHLTDRNPEKGPGDYREANQGALLVGRHVITVTILTHTGDSATVDQAKEMLRSVKISSGQ